MEAQVEVFRWLNKVGHHWRSLRWVKLENLIVKLLLAANEGHVQVLDELHSRGAEVMKTTQDFEVRLSNIPLYYSGGRTALHLAAEKNHLEAVQYLVENFPELVPLQDFDGKYFLSYYF